MTLSHLPSTSMYSRSKALSASRPSSNIPARIRYRNMRSLHCHRMRRKTPWSTNSMSCSSRPSICGRDSDRHSSLQRYWYCPYPGYVVDLLGASRRLRLARTTQRLSRSWRPCLRSLTYDVQIQVSVLRPSFIPFSIMHRFKVVRAGLNQDSAVRGLTNSR